MLLTWQAVGQSWRMLAVQSGAHNCRAALQTGTILLTWHADLAGSGPVSEAVKVQAAVVACYHRSREATEGVAAVCLVPRLAPNTAFVCLHYSIRYTLCSYVGLKEPRFQEPGSV